MANHTVMTWLHSFAVNTHQESAGEVEDVGSLACQRPSSTFNFRAQTKVVLWSRKGSSASATSNAGSGSTNKAADGGGSGWDASLAQKLSGPSNTWQKWGKGGTDDWSTWAQLSSRSFHPRNQKVLYAWTFWAFKHFPKIHLFYKIFIPPLKMHALDSHFLRRVREKSQRKPPNKWSNWRDEGLPLGIKNYKGQHIKIAQKLGLTIWDAMKITE